MRQGQAPPIEGSYWVHDRLLAGAYPGEWGWRLTARLRRLLEAGVTYVLDLTEEGEKGLGSYVPALCAAARRADRAVEHRRTPIPDFETPSVDQMRDILDVLDAALEAGHTVYVHCYAGIGRTGTVVGCYLVRHGRSGPEALEELVHLRRGSDLEGALSPITEGQRRLVYEWANLDWEKKST
jgi:protein-tyrosine phosphatase